MTRTKQIYFLIVLGVLKPLVRLCIGLIFSFIFTKFYYSFSVFSNMISISFFDFAYYVSNSSSWTEDSFGINVLPEPEPSSATALANYRAQNADAEAQLFSHIRSLESQLSYGLPPQLNNGEYAQLIRDDFETAFNVNHYRGAIARELHEVQIMLLKSRLQDLLSDHMISEPSLESILQRSPYKNIRKEAYDFIEDQVQSVSSMRYPFQRNILEGSLNQFIRDIEQNGTRAPIYREFYSYFTDAEFRRRLGL